MDFHPNDGSSSRSGLQRHSRARLSGGFTLLEMLAGISVIGLLAVLLYPALEKSMDRAKSAQCTSNLRQIGVALFSYSSDHDGRFPSYWNDPGATPPGDGELWYVQMADYGLTGKIYVCPGATYRNAERIPGLPYGDTSYGLSTTVSLAKLVGISPLSERFLAGEGNQLASWKSAGAALQYSGVINNGPTPDSDDADDATGNAGWIRYRHDHRANMLYVDGHVGIISKADVQKEVSSGEWVRHWRGE